MKSLILDKDEAITQDTLQAIRQEMPDEQAAAFLDKRMRWLEGIWKRSFVERGYIMLEFEQRILWQHLDNPLTGGAFRSFGEWIQDAAPQSRSDCYASLKAVKALIDIPREKLLEVPRCNVKVLQELSSEVREMPEVLEAAAHLSEKEFTKTISEAFPNQHIEPKQKTILNPAKGDGDQINQAIAVAMKLEGCATREEVVLMWANDYMAEVRISGRYTEDDGR